MRIYSKVFINQNLDRVSLRDDLGVGSDLIALCDPRTKQARVNAFNLLGGTGAGSGAIWKLCHSDGSVFATFSGPQLANDVFTTLPWEFRHTFDGKPRN